MLAPPILIVKHGLWIYPYIPGSAIPLDWFSENMLLIWMWFCHQVYQHQRSLLKGYPFCLQIHHHQCPFRMLKLGHQVRHPCLLRWHRRRHHHHPKFQVQEFLGHRHPRSLAVLLVLPVLALFHQVLQLLDLESLVLHLRLSQAQDFRYRVLPLDCIGAGQLNVKYALVSWMLQSMIDAFQNSKFLTLNLWNLERFGACVSCIVWLFQTIWMSMLMFLAHYFRYVWMDQCSICNGKLSACFIACCGCVKCCLVFSDKCLTCPWKTKSDWL